MKTNSSPTSFGTEKLWSRETVYKERQHPHLLPSGQQLVTKVTSMTGEEDANKTGGKVAPTELSFSVPQWAAHIGRRKVQHWVYVLGALRISF